MSRDSKTENKEQGRSPRFTAFDYLVFTGGIINLIVVSVIVGYWLVS